MEFYDSFEDNPADHQAEERKDDDIHDLRWMRFQPYAHIVKHGPRWEEIEACCIVIPIVF